MSTHAFAPTFEPFDFFAPAHGPSAFDGSGEDLLVEEPAEAAEACYALAQSGPPVPAEEVECDVDAVEIKAKWGAQVLSVAHVEPTKSFFVGEGSEIALPEASLGARRAAIVERGCVVVPAGAQATVSARSCERGQPSARGSALETFAGPTEIPLGPGSSVALEIGSVTFEITTVRKGKVTKAGLLARIAGGATGFIGLSLIGHAAIVASMAMFMPKLSADDAEAMDRDQLLLMQKYLSASAERQLDPPKPEGGSSEAASGGGSKGGEPHKGEAGAAGTPTSTPKNAHMAFEGRDHESSVPSKETIATFGMLGILGGGVERDPNAKSTPWGDVYKGSDEKSAMAMFAGPMADDAFGWGVGFSGTGEGGGGDGTGIGIDGVGSTVGGGHGKGKWGVGGGDDTGWGRGHGPGTGGHKVVSPTLRMPIEIETNGRLPREVIQRIVRQNFGRFRLCYEAGLRQNPALSGRVVTKFVIGRDGAVSSAQDAGSDLPDQAVTHCIVRSFGALSFPQPSGGIATVSYPMVLSPGE